MLLVLTLLLLTKITKLLAEGNSATINCGGFSIYWNRCPHFCWPVFLTLLGWIVLLRFSIHLSLSEAEVQLKHLLPPEYVTWQTRDRDHDVWPNAKTQRTTALFAEDLDTLDVLLDFHPSLIPSVRCVIGPRYILQHDNEPKHSERESWTTTIHPETRRTKSPAKVAWAPQSPDRKTLLEVTEYRFVLLVFSCYLICVRHCISEGNTVSLFFVIFTPAALVTLQTKTVWGAYKICFHSFSFHFRDSTECILHIHIVLLLTCTFSWSYLYTKVIL